MSRSLPIDLTHDEDDLSQVSFGCEDLFPPPVLTTEEGDAYYRVERILSMERKAEGNFYLVKWFGYPLEDATIEAESKLMVDCMEALVDFHRKRACLPARE